MAPVGGALLYASSKVQEIIIDYSDCVASAPTCPTMGLVPSGKVSASFKSATPSGSEPRWCTNTTDVPYGISGNYKVPTDTCHLQYYIPDTLHPPVLLYYQLENFYQNHRRYVKSYDQNQLQGHAVSASDIKSGDCSPLQLGEDGKPYYPCGLIANSLFNDTFFSPVQLDTIASSDSQAVYQMTTDGIAWSSDKDLYGKTKYNTSQVVPPVNWRKKYPRYDDTEFPFPPLHTDESFQVWMRTAGLPLFSKLALRNDTAPMQVGHYSMTIYDGEFDGEMSIKGDGHC